MKYKIEWLKYKNKGTAKQVITVFNPTDVEHIVKNLKEDSQIVTNSIDFYPVFGDS